MTTLTGEPYIEHTLHIEGHRLAMWEFNAGKKTDAPPIVFIHGITASKAMWLFGQAEHVKQNYHWYALSLPGHFPAMLPSHHRADEINARTHARIMGKAIACCVGERPVILAGHSIGGFAALNIAANASDRLNIAGVISVSGFAHGRWTGALGILQWLARSGSLGHAVFFACFLGVKSSLAMFKLAVSLYGHNRRALFAHPALEATFNAMLPYMKRMDGNAMRQYFYRMPQIDISTDLPTITAPTLVISGTKDNIVPSEQSRKIAAGVTNAELVMMPDVGHMPMIERATEYNEVVAAWLMRHFI